jgi:hypothetical protein
MRKWKVEGRIHAERLNNLEDALRGRAGLFLLSDRNSF